MNWWAIGLLAAALAGDAEMETQRAGGRDFRVASGLTIELAAGPPLVERPICAALDETGTLYVAESSGSNDRVEKQLADRPHKILKLVDRDGDGRFDQRTELVSNIMFPEGALWHQGSLYVCAPPQIWKFTDADGDGRAEQQEVWYDPGTLTGCANDLHGPYLGPDGWIYWCKGAFASQQHELTDGSRWETRAAHIFRRRPEGGPVEVVMTGGMDNPVEVAFTRGGERIFTTTFLQHPGGGNRDGLIHAVYGGLYGKDHDVLRGHVRTGDLMPVLEHFGAAAPAGLTRLETDGLGSQWRDQLLACSFNLHQVSAHRLTAAGATFSTSPQLLVASDDLDFHPTDVLEDHDGSVLVVNTGGWYKLCCPTSSLWKPDVLGAIYRVKAHRTAEWAADSLGKSVDWRGASAERLADLLQDPRQAVWRRAQRTLVDGRVEGGAVRVAAALRRRLSQWNSDADGTRPERWAWTLGQINHPQAREALYEAAGHADESVSLAALHSISVQRDAAGLPAVLDVLSQASSSAARRRAAAEALGRLGQPESLEPLVEAIRHADPEDRVLRHSLTYALWETRRPADLLAQLRREGLSDAQRAALLWATDQQSASPLEWRDVAECLTSDDPWLVSTAWWVVQRHGDWSGELREWLAQRWSGDGAGGVLIEPAARFLVAHLQDPAMEAWVAEGLSGSDGDGRWPREVRGAVLDAIAGGSPKLLPESIGQRWSAAWVAALSDPPAEASSDNTRGDAEAADADGAAVANGLSQREAWLASVLGALRRVVGDDAVTDPQVRDALIAWASNQRLNAELRLSAMWLSVEPGGRVEDAWFEWIWQQLTPDMRNSPGRKMLALDLCERSKLSDEQLRRLAAHLESATPYELTRMVEVCLAKAGDRPELVREVLARLSKNDAAPSLDPKWLVERVASSDAAVVELRGELERRMIAARADVARKIEDRLLRLPPGEVRRGQEVFHSTRAACITCHAMGYLGGRLGPDLTNIGRIRSRRDLIESLLFPSATWVRSYEPVSAVLVDGRVVSGLLQSESPDEIVLAANATLTHRLARAEIEELRVGGASVMPEGLGDLLTDQQLADLLVFLESSR